MDTIESNNVYPKVIELPRGGTLVETRVGAVQFGVPPETIKDTMVLPIGVPKVFVLPRYFFDINRGISVAEIEFPVYYNFFIRRSKVVIICDEARIQNVETAMNEALFGPQTIDLTLEVNWENPEVCVPDLKKEIDYFRKGMKLEDAVQFIPIKNGKAEYEVLTIRMDDDGNFRLYEDGQHLIDLPGEIQFSVKLDLGKVQEGPFIPPRMGITCLGPSHGFDPKQATSGFCLWMNNKGIMIDPPVASTDWLHQSNVNPKYIDSIILTHAHADHDAGTFQKILAEEKVTIYTTKTIISSFIKKYSSLTGIPENQLIEMFNFRPVRLGETVVIHQGHFTFFYTLHSLPTIGFKVEFRGKTFIYSSDHLNDPPQISRMHQSGLLSDCRRDQLTNFPWECDVIYHEAGIPPLHTQVSFLNSLPQDVQKRIMVYHIAEKDFPEKTDLTLATFGIGHTRIVDVPERPYDSACDILHILEKVEYFNSFTLSKIYGLLSVLQRETFKKGEIIFEKGSMGDKFYIITSGNIKIQGIVTSAEKKYGDYETFGEASLLYNRPRDATVVAATDVEVITIEKTAFLNLIEGTDLREKLSRLENRSAETWDLLFDSPVFKSTTSFQKTNFEAIMKPVPIKAKDKIIERGKLFDRMYIIHSGTVSQDDGAGKQRILKRGELVGDIVSLQKNMESRWNFVALEDGKLFEIEQKDMLDYIQTYPNVYMNLIYQK